MIERKYYVTSEQIAKGLWPKNTIHEHGRNRERGYWLGIDVGLGSEMRERFDALGLSDLFH